MRVIIQIFQDYHFNRWSRASLLQGVDPGSMRSRLIPLLPTPSSVGRLDESEHPFDVLCPWCQQKEAI